MTDFIVVRQPTGSYPIRTDVQGQLSTKEKAATHKRAAANMVSVIASNVVPAVVPVGNERIAATEQRVCGMAEREAFPHGVRVAPVVIVLTSPTVKAVGLLGGNGTAHHHTTTRQRVMRFPTKSHGCSFP